IWQRDWVWSDAMASSSDSEDVQPRHVRSKDEGELPTIYQRSRAFSMHRMFQVTFALDFRSGARFGAALLFLALLNACSQSPRSLADYIAAICAKPFRSAPNAEMPYLTENIDAMTKMMIDMGIRPSGDVDRDFVAMMTPHHQGAIEMAQAELR